MGKTYAPNNQMDAIAEADEDGEQPQDGQESCGESISSSASSGSSAMSSSDETQTPVDNVASLSSRPSEERRSSNMSSASDVDSGAGLALQGSSSFFSDASTSPESSGLSPESSGLGPEFLDAHDVTQGDSWRIVAEQVCVLRDSFENSTQATLSGLSDDSPVTMTRAWDSVVALLEQIQNHPSSSKSGSITSAHLEHVACVEVLRMRKEKEDRERKIRSGSKGSRSSSKESTSARDRGIIFSRESLLDRDCKSQPANPEENSILWEDKKGAEGRRMTSNRSSINTSVSEHDLRDFLREKSIEKPLPRCFIHPSHPGRIVWDITSLTIVLIDSVLMPFEMAYRANAPENFWFWIGTCFFTCDLIINFFTGFIAGPLEKDHGQLVTSKKRIAKHYLMSWFLIDLASTVPWSVLVKQIVGNNSESAGGARMAKVAKIAKLARFMRLARMLKLLKLNTLWENFESMIGSMVVVHILQLLKVLCLIAFICHWNACIWWALGNPFSIFNDEEEEGGTTMKELDEAGLLEGRHWTTVVHRNEASTVEGRRWSRSFRWLDCSELDTYIFCFYWTLGVMRTMPVEVYPVNEKERVYVLCFMFFAFSVFSICVSKITTMFKKINARRSEFDENMAALRSYLHELGVSKDLQGRIKSFLEFKFIKRRIFAKETMLLKELTEGLQSELKLAKMGAALQSMWLFRGLRKEELTQIVLTSHEADAAPMDLIAHEGDVATQCWLLMSGGLTATDPTIPVKLRRTERPIKHVDMDTLTSITPTVSEKTIWATDYSELIVIKQQEFLELRRMHPELDAHILEIVKEVKDIDLEDSHSLKRSDGKLFERQKQELEDEDPFQDPAPKRATRMRRSRNPAKKTNDDDGSAGAVAAAI